MLKYSSNFFSFAKWMPHSAQFSKMKCIKVSFPQFNHYPSWIPKNSLIRKKPTSLKTTNWSTTTDWSNDIKQGQLVKNPTKQTANLVRQALTSHLWASVPHKVGLCVSSQVQHHKAGEAWSAKPRVGVGARVSLTNHALPAPVTASPDCTASQSCAALRISGRLLL